MIEGNTLACFFRDNAAVRHIALIAEKHFDNVGGRMLKTARLFMSANRQKVFLFTHCVDILKPFCYIIEAFGICNIVNEHYTHCAAIIRGCDRVKALLASGIPKSKSNNISKNFSINFKLIKCFNYEVFLPSSEHK